MRTSERTIMTTCSATLMLLLKVTSATVIPCAMAASRSTWSEPMPAVTALTTIAVAAISARRRKRCLRRVARGEIGIAPCERHAGRLWEELGVEIEQSDRGVQPAVSGEIDGQLAQRPLAEIVGRAPVVRCAQRTVRACGRVEAAGFERGAQDVLERHRPVHATVAGKAGHLDGG